MSGVISVSYMLLCITLHQLHFLWSDCAELMYYFPRSSSFTSYYALSPEMKLWRCQSIGNFLLLWRCTEGVCVGGNGRMQPTMIIIIIIIIMIWEAHIALILNHDRYLLQYIYGIFFIFLMWFIYDIFLFLTSAVLCLHFLNIFIVCTEIENLFGKPYSGSWKINI